MCPWDEEQQKLIRRTVHSVERAVEVDRRNRSAVFLGLINEHLSIINGLWYRAGGGVHHFALILHDPDEPSLNTAYQIELDLQKEFPADSFDFDILRSDAMDKESLEELRDRGYSKVEG